MNFKFMKMHHLSVIAMYWNEMHQGGLKINMKFATNLKIAYKCICLERRADDFDSLAHDTCVHLLMLLICLTICLLLICLII